MGKLYDGFLSLPVVFLFITFYNLNIKNFFLYMHLEIAATSFDECRDLTRVNHVLKCSNTVTSTSALLLSVTALQN